MKLTSPDMPEGVEMNVRFTCDGSNESPTLQWSDEPEGTKSYVLIVDDPDAPSGVFTHWVLYDIPASSHELSEGSTAIGIPGKNEFDDVGYGGPCPPHEHGAHRYHFKLFAMDCESLHLEPAASRRDVERAMQKHILDRAEIVREYERQPA